MTTDRARRLDPEALKTFVEVARQGSFSAAAERLNKTPAAISYRIRALEENMGTPLFERTTRSVTLTPAGELLLERATDVFTSSPSVVDLEELHAKIGQLTLEKDFLQGALSKPAIFTKVGNIGICLRVENRREFLGRDFVSGYCTYRTLRRSLVSSIERLAEDKFSLRPAPPFEAMDSGNPELTASCWACSKLLRSCIRSCASAAADSAMRT